MPSPDPSSSRPKPPAGEDPLVLGIDSATPPSSVALVRGARVVAWSTGPFGRHTDAWILDAIDRLLRDNGVALSDLTAIAAGIGPGTFTGIRVAIATAQGLGRGARVRSIGVSTLRALARCAAADSPALLLPLLDARRGQLYAAVAQRHDSTATILREPWLATADEVVAGYEELGTPALLGTGVATDPRLQMLTVAETAEWPLAAGVALLATDDLRRHGLDAAAPPLPYYLRRPDARVGRNPLDGA